jgi:hypothetical protein
MTLGNMRANGVRSLAVTCELCHHAARSERRAVVVCRMATRIFGDYLKQQGRLNARISRIIAAPREDPIPHSGVRMGSTLL